MNLFKKFFKSKFNSNSEEKLKPNPGELWEFVDRSPWRRHYPPVIILAIKDNWIRYDLPPLFMDQRMELKDFLCNYKKVKQLKDLF